MLWTILFPSLRRSPTPAFKPDQLWQGKQQKTASLEPLSKADKERVTKLAVSVWDDEDAIGGYNYGDPDDDGREAEQIRREKEHYLAASRGSGSGGQDLTYDGTLAYFATKNCGSLKVSVSTLLAQGPLPRDYTLPPGMQRRLCIA